MIFSTIEIRVKMPYGRDCYGNLLYTGDNESYIMLGDNTKVTCVAIDFHGNKLYNGQKIGPVRIMDQRIFYSDILYCAEYPIGSNKIIYTRASLIDGDDI